MVDDSGLQTSAYSLDTIISIFLTVASYFRIQQFIHHD